MNRCLVFFVEGATELEFYRRLVACLKRRTQSGRFETYIEYKNVKGIGGFKHIALRKFSKEIQPKYEKNCEFTVVLCFDSDVFELTTKPPVSWKDLKSDLLAYGASKVILLQAKRSIEDWFLYDSEGVIGFLKLPQKTKVTGKDGYHKLINLYKQANKIYYKGVSSNGMIESLNMEKIMEAIKDQLNPLYETLGIGISK